MAMTFVALRVGAVDSARGHSDSERDGHPLGSQHRNVDGRTATQLRLSLLMRDDALGRRGPHRCESSFLDADCDIHTRTRHCSNAVSPGRKDMWLQ